MIWMRQWKNGQRKYGTQREEWKAQKKFRLKPFDVNRSHVNQIIFVLLREVFSINNNGVENPYNEIPFHYHDLIKTYREFDVTTSLSSLINNLSFTWNTDFNHTQDSVKCRQ